MDTNQSKKDEKREPWCGVRWLCRASCGGPAYQRGVWPLPGSVATLGSVRGANFVQVNAVRFREWGNQMLWFGVFVYIFLHGGITLCRPQTLKWKFIGRFVVWIFFALCYIYILSKSKKNSEDTNCSCKALWYYQNLHVANPSGPTKPVARGQW